MRSLTLLSVPPGEASRLDPDDDQFYDYTDKAPVDVKVPVYSYSADGSFVQFHLHLNGELVSMRRYSEFIALQGIQGFTFLFHCKFPQLLRVIVNCNRIVYFDADVFYL